MTNITEKSRALKDIKKLKEIMREFLRLKLNKKYRAVYEWVKNYANDAEYFYKNKDYFASFGCVNYAYGFVDCILILEGKKKEELPK